MKKSNIRWLVPLVAGHVALIGCTTMNEPVSNDVSQLKDQLEGKQQEIVALKSSLSNVETSLENERLAREQLVASETSGAASDLLPPAKPGECYARIFIAPDYKTSEETVLRAEASEIIKTIPPVYEWGEKRVLVKEASERLEIIPATYEWTEEQMLVSPAGQRLEPVPGQYKFETEQMLIKPEHTVWKKGKGPITRIDASTGEIMCLVTIPATYKTVKRRVVVASPTTRAIEIPAAYKTVKKRILRTAATTRKVEIPAEYTTVKIRRLVSLAKTESTPIPAKYETVTKRIMVSEGHLEWRQILCETNTSPGVVQRIQSALDRAGYNPGPIDGVIGVQTLGAVKSYQRAKGFPRGRLTIKTLESLGVALN